MNKGIWFGTKLTLRNTLEITRQKTRQKHSDSRKISFGRDIESNITTILKLVHERKLNNWKSYLTRPILRPEISSNLPYFGLFCIMSCPKSPVSLMLPPVSCCVFIFPQSHGQKPWKNGNKKCLIYHPEVFFFVFLRKAFVSPLA